MEEWVVSKTLLISILLSVGLLISSSCFAQDKKSLQKQIRLTDKLLHETKGQREKTFTELNILEQQIHLRSELIQTLEEEIRAYEAEIDEMDLILCQMDEDLEAIKANYVETVKKTYKSFDSDHFWLSVLSSGSLSEAYYRMIYFKQYSNHRKQQVKLILQSQEFLKSKSAQLNEIIRQKETLLEEKLIEVELLSGDRNTQSSLFSELKKKEKSYRDKLNKQRNELKAILRKTETTMVSPAKNDQNDYARTFLRNKGFHSWPVPSSNGLIVGTFGKTKDPYGNTVTNDGVFIRIPQGEKARAVHTGRVTGVQALPIGGKMVILEHGSYRTVYANLASTEVEVGQLVKTGEKIGVVRTDTRTGETTLNFLVYKIPDVFLDPQQWIIQK